MAAVPGTRLGIAIPTYNRAEFLRESLGRIAACAAPLGIPVYVSDNCSDDDTGEVVARLNAKYGDIVYRRNDTNVRDRNFRLALAMAETDYVLLLADYTLIQPDTLSLILQALEDGDCDALVVNGDGRVHGLDSQTFRDPDRLLRRLGWHMTWLSCLVFSRGIIHSYSFERYQGSSFTQTAAIFDYLCRKDGPVRVRWEAGILYAGNVAEKKNAWVPKVLEIFCVNWYDTIMSLPAPLTEKSKRICIRQHGRKSKLFTYFRLFMYKARGFMPRRAYRLYRTQLEAALPFGPILVYAYFMLPEAPFAFLYPQLKRFRESLRSIISELRLALSRFKSALSGTGSL